VPAERAIWPPLPIFISTLWTMVPTGMLRERHGVARLHVDLSPATTCRRPQALRRQDVGELAVLVFDQRDEGGAVRIVFEPLDLAGMSNLRRLKSTMR
jgi:hypothetical protein